MEKTISYCDEKNYVLFKLYLINQYQTVILYICICFYTHSVGLNSFIYTFMTMFMFLTSLIDILEF